MTNIDEDSKNSVSSCDVLPKLFEDRIIFINKRVSKELTTTIISQLLFLEAQNNKEDITIYINSDGGSVLDMLAIYDTIQLLKCDVVTICTGVAYSAAAFILAAGTAGKRFALKHSDIMLHEMCGNHYGTVSERKLLAKRTDRLHNNIITLLALHCNKTTAEIEQAKSFDNYMSADEAKSFGIIDNILSNAKERKKEPAKSKKIGFQINN